ncbi:MAG TPA: hypothetical protein VMB81_06095 [Candidatus Sulfotelmatobacter sp.]|nr:hypothetical protein [Candidatus Sulfotelmatobacter sp.]
MPYFVKWTLHGQDKVLGSKFPYAQPAAARDFACGALGQKPKDIWIEDEHGTRIDDELAIIRHCTKQVKVATFRPVAQPQAAARRKSGSGAD